MPDASKITREYALGHRLVFFPKSTEEAQAIQEAIFKMGFYWADGDKEVKKLPECVDKGILLDHGKLYYHPTKSSANIVCQTEMLDENYLPPAEKRMQEMFNTLMARIDDLSEQIARIEKQVGPDELQKPRKPPPLGKGRAP
jgi:hypothetical protein